MKRKFVFQRSREYNYVVGKKLGINLFTNCKLFDFDDLYGKITCSFVEFEIIDSKISMSDFFDY